MHRQFSIFALALLAVGVVAVAPAMADDEALREEVQQLQKQYDALSTQSQKMDQEIEEYLDDNKVWQGAQGGSKWDDVTVVFRITAVGLASVGNDDPPEGPGNFHDVNGDVDLDFTFNITENLTGFLFLNGTSFSNVDWDDLGEDGDLLDDGDTLTASGLTDGIGINGTKPVSATDGDDITALNVYEAYIDHVMTLGNNQVHVMWGKLDPRRHFAQNRYRDDENTQFLNNLFDDSPSTLWLSDLSGRVYLGAIIWTEFGDGKWRVDGGWFNTPGEWFTQGQFYVQLTLTTEISGRPTHFRFYGWIDEFFRDATGDGSSGGGVSWDWELNDKMGLFVTIASTGGDVNPVDMDATIGLQWKAVFGSRPDDILGIGVGWISLNTDPTTIFARDDGSRSFAAPIEDTELTLEIYYVAMYEGGKYQVTPFLQFINDPYQITETFAGSPSPQDSLFILGIRFFVFF